MKIPTVTLSSWEEIHKHAKKGWLYRGQRSRDWELATSVERCFERVGIARDKRAEVEATLLQDFRRAYHHYAGHVPKADSMIEWLSLMQHHGAPTRLLDFTYSIYVAAYFALESADAGVPCAIWAMDGPWLLGQSIDALKRASKADPEILRKESKEDQEKAIYDLLFGPPPVKLAAPQNPFRLNERLRIQKGVFVIPGDVTASFMENLGAFPDVPNRALKIEFRPDVRKEAIERLYYMNISRTSLFPGIDGYAQSLGVYHPAFDPVDWSAGAGRS